MLQVNGLAVLVVSYKLLTLILDRLRSYTREPVFMLDHLSTKRTNVQYETPANVAYVAWRKPVEKPLPKSNNVGFSLRTERVVLAPN